MIGILGLVTKENGGIFQYAISMVQALASFGKRFSFRLFRTVEFPAGLTAQEIEISDFNVGLDVKLRRYLYLKTGIRLGNLASFLSQQDYRDIDLFIAPITTLLPFYLGKPYIVTIHDLQHKHYPHFFSRRERLKRDYLYKTTAENARVILCESTFVKQDICTYLNIPEEKVMIVPSPPPQSIICSDITQDQLEGVKRKYRLPPKYLFYPAQFWPHKNHLNLIRALHLLRQDKGINIPLILIGSKQNYYSHVEREIQQTDLSDQVRYLGYVPDEDISSLYKLSTGLAMPTLFESVSLPIWEAMYLGVPVVTSNVCALPEQLGENGLYFNPLNIADIAEKLFLFWTNDALRKELAFKSKKRIASMTLENYALKLEQIFQNVSIQ